MTDERVDRACATVLGMSWDDIGVIDAGGALHFPAKLERRTADGSVEAEAVMLRLVDNPRRFRARVRAREWARELKLDAERDRDLCDELEN